MAWGHRSREIADSFQFRESPPNPRVFFAETGNPDLYDEDEDDAEFRGNTLPTTNGEDSDNEEPKGSAPQTGASEGEEVRHRRPPRRLI